MKHQEEAKLDGQAVCSPSKHRQATFRNFPPQRRNVWLPTLRDMVMKMTEIHWKQTSKQWLLPLASQDLLVLVVLHQPTVEL